jgi:hypothetical protein
MTESAFQNTETTFNAELAEVAEPIVSAVSAFSALIVVNFETVL